MNKLPVRLLIIICSFILAVLIIILFFQLKSESRLRDFYSGLREIDRNIDDARYPQASAGLTNLYKEIYSSKTALMYLKRLSRLSSVTGDYRNYLKAAEGLSSRFVRNIEISAVYVHALQKRGRYEKAWTVSDLSLKKSEYYQLHLLNCLETGVGKEDLRVQEYFREDYSYNTDSSETVDFTALYEKLNDDRLLLDAALKSAVNGVDGAVVILERTAKDFRTDLKAVMYYDAGDPGKALQYLNETDLNRTDDFFLLSAADILVDNSRIDDAAGIYEMLLEKDPGISVIPYRNLYSFNSGRAERLTWIERGLEYYPEAPLLRIPSIWEMRNNDDQTAASEAVEQLNDADASSGLFKLQFMPSGRNPEHVVGNYWNIFNLSPGYEITAVSFAAFLMRHKLLDELSLLLNRYENEAGPEGWIDTYRAVGSAMKGDYSEAEEFINSALATDKNSMNYYNKAVIVSLSGRWIDADRLLKQAIESRVDNSQDAKIYLKAAEAALMLDDPVKAERFNRKLLELQPDSIRGNLLKKKIQEQYR